MKDKITNAGKRMVIKDKTGHLIPRLQPELLKDQIIWMVENN
jgi:hypothetical protein